MCLPTKHGTFVIMILIVVDINFVKMKRKNNDNMIKQYNISKFMIVSKSCKAEKYSSLL